jgi:hypothetical protein
MVVPMVTRVLPRPFAQRNATKSTATTSRMVSATVGRMLFPDRYPGAVAAPPWVALPERTAGV